MLGSCGGDSFVSLDFLLRRQVMGHCQHHRTCQTSACSVCALERGALERGALLPFSTQPRGLHRSLFPSCSHSGRVSSYGMALLPKERECPRSVGKRFSMFLNVSTIDIIITHVIR